MQAFWMAMHGDPKNEDVHMNTHKKQTKQKKVLQESLSCLN